MFDTNLKFEAECEQEYWYEAGLKDAVADMFDNSLYDSIGGGLDLDTPPDVSPEFYDDYLNGYWFIVNSLTY